METVQLQCGHCKKVMAIGVEHLGSQVQCPHCKGVVQTPPRTSVAAPPAAPPPPPAPEIPAPPADSQPESIFTGPESDTVLGDAQQPQVEMPSTPSEETVTPPPEPDADLTQFKRRPIYTGSVLTMYAFIFLVPYAILATAAIVYLLVMRPPPIHPLDMMPDPQPGKNKGGPTRTDHKVPLADHQKVAIGSSIQVGKDGDLMVTPEKVAWSEQGELQLFLRAKNISTNTAFQPVSGYWMTYNPELKGSDQYQYTYIESRSHNLANIYGADLAFRSSAKDTEDRGEAVLQPGKETIVVLTTLRNPLVADIGKASDTYTWRVQLRRGFVKHRDRDVSTTAVIGVEFKSSEIEGKRG